MEICAGECADELPVRQRKFKRVRSELQTHRYYDSRAFPLRRTFYGSHISNYVTASLNLNTYGPTAFSVSLMRTFWVLLCGASNQITSHVDGKILRQDTQPDLVAVLHGCILAAKTRVN